MYPVEMYLTDTEVGPFGVVYASISAQIYMNPIEGVKATICNVYHLQQNPCDIRHWLELSSYLGSQ